MIRRNNRHKNVISDTRHETSSLNTVEIAYHVTMGTEYFVSLQTSVVITECRYNRGV